MAKRQQLRKQKKRQERIRVHRHLHRYGSLPGDEARPTAKRTGVPQSTLNAGAYILEKQLRGIHKAIQGKGFTESSEINQYLKSIMSPDGKILLDEEESPQERAQDLAFEALAASDPAEAVDKAKQAVQIDPDCVDARTVLAIHDTGTLDERIDALKKAVEAGERTLGEEALEENKGRMWGMPFARPYMRARVTLGEQLVIAERHGEARECFEQTLALNPGDNQGVRYSLLGCLLALTELDEAKMLLKAFEDGMDTTLMWGRVMLEFLAGHGKPAERARRKARRMNPSAERYLLGAGEDGADSADSPEEMEEAISCSRLLGHVLKKHPELEAWLRSGWESVARGDG